MAGRLTGLPAESAGLSARPFFMKNAFKLSGTLVLLYTACSAEFQVGNGAFQLDTSLAGIYDSNLRDSASGISDFSLNFQPTLRYRSIGSRFNTEAYVGERFRRYLDHSSFNSDDVDSRLNWHMSRVDGHTTAAELAVGYVENTEAVVEVNDLVRTKTFFANASGEVLMAGRNLFSAGLSYRDSQRSIGSNQTGSEGRLGYSYVGFTDGSALSFNYSHQQNKSTENTTGATSIDQKADTGTVAFSHPLYADLIGSVTYGYRWLDRGEQEKLLGLPNRRGSLYSLNLEGPFLPRKYFPKTTGTFRVSYEQAAVPGLNDSSNKRLVGQIDLTWTARERTTLRYFASRSQDLTINDNTVVNESTGLTLTQGIGSFINTDFTVRYTNANYVNLIRTDDRYEARAGATYKINRLWSSALYYSFLHSTSNATVANFDRHVVSGTVTYAF
jgi:hypothetical protein